MTIKQAKNRYFCPFCMELHEYSVTECPTKNRSVPEDYIKAIQRGVPVIPFLTVGYTMDGKTCFLSVLFYELYLGGVPKAWNNFNPMPMNEETWDRIKGEFVDPLTQGRLPDRSAVMLPVPLILKLENLPMRPNGLRRYIFDNHLRPSEVILIFYDIGGEAYRLTASINEYLPIIHDVNTLIFLIDLPKLISSSSEGGSDVAMEMYQLLNTVNLTIGEKVRDKRLILCFTKADRMWGDENRFGPLSIQTYNGIPKPSELPEYSRYMKDQSEKIKQYLKEKYTVFANLCSTYKSVSYMSISALGTEPRQVQRDPPKYEIDLLESSQIINPLLWMLKHEGYL
jgi:hypothetical protein